MFCKILKENLLIIKIIRCIFYDVRVSMKSTSDTGQWIGCQARNQSPNVEKIKDSRGSQTTHSIRQTISVSQG